MKQHSTTSTLLSSLFAAGILALALPVNAQQMGPGMMGNTAPGPGAQQMSGLQHDMATQMMGMAGEMAKGNMNVTQQKLMGERMRMMGAMMGEMSGKKKQNKKKKTETQNRMNQMRMQMD